MHEARHVWNMIYILHSNFVTSQDRQTRDVGNDEGYRRKQGMEKMDTEQNMRCKGWFNEYRKDHDFG